MSHPDSNHGNGHGGSHQHHHFILPNKMILTIGGCLLVLTAITVAVAHVDLGRLNFVVAMFIATVKALLVALFFMNLKYDARENGVIFATSFLFLAIFIIFTSTDLFFRGDVYVKGPLLAPSTAQAKGKFAKPWLPNPELVARGNELFHQQCVTCHGEGGQGNGPAASALNPPPRNFTQTVGWKNGRKMTMIFKTLKEGLPPSAMSSFATLPAEDRWALAQYVLTFNKTAPETDTHEDFEKIGVDPNQDQTATTEKVESIPVELAIDRMAVPSTDTPMDTAVAGGPAATTAGARIYQESCLQCHGAHGEGARVANLGVMPKAYVTTQPFSRSLPSLQSLSAFSGVVAHGIPGNVMPGNGQLSGAELSELFDHVKSLAAGR